MAASIDKKSVYDICTLASSYVIAYFINFRQRGMSIDNDAGF